MSQPNTVQEPRWRRLPEERPRQLIEAAFEVFGERGLADAKLDDIARRAGVSKGTIYLYFPNKEELFREMIRHAVVTRIEEGERIAATASGTAVERLRGFMYSWWQYVRSPEYQTIYRLVISELHRFPDLAEFYSREVVARAHRLLSGMIARGIADGEFRPVDPHAIARILAGMFISQGFWCAKLQCYVDDPARLSDAQVLEHMADFALHALQLTPTSASTPSEPASPEHHE